MHLFHSYMFVFFNTGCDTYKKKKKQPIIYCWPSPALVSMTTVAYSQKEWKHKSDCYNVHARPQVGGIKRAGAPIAFQTAVFRIRFRHETLIKGPGNSTHTKKQKKNVS